MNQPKRSFSVLIIEDNPGDQLLLQESLNDTNLVIDDLTIAETISEATAILGKRAFSIIFLDLFLPDSSGLETLTQLASLYSKIPVIICSGLSDMKIAVKAISRGAQDYLIKGDYTSALLEKAVRYSIERKDAEQLIKTSEENYRYLFDNNPVSILIWDLETFRILEVNEAAIHLYRYRKEEFLQKTIFDIRAGNDREKLLKVKSVLQIEDHYYSGQSKHLKKDGEIISMDISSHRIVFNGNPAVLALGSDITEQMLLQEKLSDEKIKKQQEITAAVITAQTRERSFIGEELHDNINQILATANIYLDCALTNEDLRVTYLKDSRQFVKEAIDEIRKLSKSLLPPSLGEVGLQDALNHVIEKITKVNDSIRFDMNWQITDENTLNEKLQLTIFRIVQEQLNNIFKHARASNITITLKEMEEVVELSVKDDGVGFDTSEKRNGIGLRNIFQRASLSEGTVVINSQPGNGCELIVRFTCQNELASALIA